MLQIGAHESTAGGLHLAFERINAVGGKALQIFTRNQRQWKAAPLSPEEIALFAAAWKQTGAIPVASHASYLINLSTAKPDLRTKSIQAFVDEIKRCEQLSIPLVVIHPGSHGGDGIEAGLTRMAAALDQVLEKADSPEVMILLETTAGQGTGLGSRFEELGWLLQHSRFPERLGVCLDTCHIFAAGYDLRSPESYQQTMIEFDRFIGRDKLRFIHLNDSKKELGCRVDRHEHIGQGAIGLEGFSNVVNDPDLKQIPMTLETPKDKDLSQDRSNLATLHGLIRS
ncbi:MAG: deoxyribonuclease IV [Desulfobulbaceae bacterium]|uniref:Probable endonuclease 4 n=1 Tax=Candidatus Desulfatifera sulfidica TaxID=2841691 RepID=A0A8J6N6X0_9BACT|nr:deoxyribonuclease IV [Candidatus Desulfatifera sulfidica]